MWIGLFWQDNYDKEIQERCSERLEGDDYNDRLHERRKSHPTILVERMLGLRYVWSGKYINIVARNLVFFNAD